MTFWNCNKNYPGRYIKDVLYDDDIIQSTFINCVQICYDYNIILNKPNIIFDKIRDISI